MGSKNKNLTQTGINLQEHQSKILHHRIAHGKIESGKKTSDIECCDSDEQRRAAREALEREIFNHYFLGYNGNG